MTAASWLLAVGVTAPAYGLTGRAGIARGEKQDCTVGRVSRSLGSAVGSLELSPQLLLCVASRKCVGASLPMERVDVTVKSPCARHDSVMTVGSVPSRHGMNGKKFSGAAPLLDTSFDTNHDVEEIT
jgi:hypothetical protein